MTQRGAWVNFRNLTFLLVLQLQACLPVKAPTNDQKAPSNITTNPREGSDNSNPQPPTGGEIVTPSNPGSTETGTTPSPENERTAFKTKQIKLMSENAEAWFSNRNRSGVQTGSCAMSCHTTLPFVLSADFKTEPAKSTAKLLMDDIESRVKNWATAKPHYSWAPEASKATESILNAVALTQYDRKVTESLRPVTCEAFKAMFALQNTDGGWTWMNAKLAPFENAPAAIWGASLAYLAAGRAVKLSQGSACFTADLEAKLTRLRTFLKTKFAAADLHEKIWIDWADKAWAVENILKESDREEIRKALETLQQTDGGFRSIDLHAARTTTFAYKSDPYATALAAIFLLNSTGPSFQAMLGKISEYSYKYPLSSNLESFSLNDPTDSFNNSLSTDTSRAYFMLILKEVTTPTIIH